MGGRGGGRYGLGRGGMRTVNSHSFRPSEGPIGFGKSAGRPSPRGKCFYCEKEGNWKWDCSQKKADKGKESNRAPREEQSGLTFTVYKIGNTTKHLLGWIIDSGASQHLCSNKGSFIRGTYEAITPQGIEIANESRIDAIRGGDMCVGELM